MPSCAGDATQALSPSRMTTFPLIGYESVWPNLRAACFGRQPGDVHARDRHAGEYPAGIHQLIAHHPGDDSRKEQQQSGGDRWPLSVPESVFSAGIGNDKVVMRRLYLAHLGQSNGRGARRRSALCRNGRALSICFVRRALLDGAEVLFASRE